MLLSIGIPTHHGRMKSLRDALDSILRQVTDDLRGRFEICVSDNASADGTQEMMAEYQRQYGADLVVYHRSEVNKEFLGNMLHLVEMARGEFCWFLGSDDQFRGDKGIVTMLAVLEQHRDTAGVSVNWHDFFKFVDKKKHEEIEGEPAEFKNEYLLAEESDKMHVYTSHEEILRHCGIPHTYISSNAVSKRLWLEVVAEEGVDTLAKYFYYPHVYVLGLMCKKQPKWVWVPDRLIRHRIGNDAMVEYFGWEFHSQTIAVMHDLSNVWAVLLGKKSPVYRNLMAKQALWAWRPGSIRWIKNQWSYRSVRDDWTMLREFTKHLHFVPGFWYKTFPSLLLPHFLTPGKQGLVRRVLRARELLMDWIKGEPEPDYIVISRKPVPNQQAATGSHA